MTRALFAAAVLAVLIPTLDKAMSNTALLALEYGTHE